MTTPVTDSGLTDSDEQRWRAMLEWLKGHGMLIDEDHLLVRPKHVADVGNGLFAIVDIPRQRPLFSAAQQDQNQCRDPRTLPPFKPADGDSAHTAMSPTTPNFGPYISMLPRDFGSHPLTWVVHQSLGVASREECKVMDLLPPSVLAELLLLEKRFRTDWEADNLPELSQQRRSKGMNTRCLYDDLGLDKDDNMSLCPPLREGESENWQVERRTPGERGNLDLVCVSCDRGIARDQEVTLRYGWHPNRTLFVEYGFVNAIKSEELMSGVYPGEVNVQDIVTDLLDQQGDAGTFVKKTLDAEGYWG
ncbi:hypothetical protein EDB89DRAFT_1919603 [Lactarius sanguifluus]|nr:hypothetical protein EDB89DRAFT_1919603 [Lactarius sanguifluus]